MSAEQLPADDDVKRSPWATWGGINAEIASIENACKQCGTVLAFEGDECGLCKEFEEKT
jgi:hypothetical protein